MPSSRDPRESEPPAVRPWPRLALLAGLFVVAVAGTVMALSAAEMPAAPEPEPAPESFELGAAPGALAGDLAVPEPGTEAHPADPEPEVTRGSVVEGRIDPGATLAASLSSQDVPPETIALISRKMSPYFDFRHARAGHTYRLVRDPRGRVVDFRYRVSSTASYHLWGDKFGYQVEREEVELVPQTVRLAGLVSTTLYSAVVDLGESGQLARDFADVFAWDIDFQRSVRPGDEFVILYERLQRTEPDGSLVYVRPGRILAAHYAGSAGTHTAIYYEPEEGRGGYYRPDGTSVQRQFLMAPLRHARVSSHYSAARRHPILKITRPHRGIDYAAPAGTPVWSVAGGEVIYRAPAGGFGNLVKVRHANGYVSYYAHLSRYARGLRVGQRVEQKQVIGYVGQTGLATGPHVCFRIAKDGQYVNPARISTPAGAPIPPEQLPRFEAARDVALAELGAGLRVATEGL